MSGSTAVPGHRSTRAEREIRRSWFALAAMPVAFVVAMLVGEGLIGALGYDEADQGIPLGTVLAAGLPAVLILISPAVLAMYFGRRAHRAGWSGMVVPARIGGVVAVAGVVLNVLPLVIRG